MLPCSHPVGLGELHVATQYFELAIRQGDQFQAYYYLAELASMAAGPQENCPAIVSFYKLVTERGDWEHEVWWEAERAHERGDSRAALLGYWIMAERGYEVAQNNVAWILDRGPSPSLSHGDMADRSEQTRSVSVCPTWINRPLCRTRRTASRSRTGPAQQRRTMSTRCSRWATTTTPVWAAERTRSLRRRRQRGSIAVRPTRT